MKKIANELDNMLDNLLIDIIDPITKSLYQLKITPNEITIFSTIIGLLSFYFLWNFQILNFIVCFVLYYFLDCMDGYYARKYNMVTVVGDYLDHIRDLIIFILLIIVFIARFKLCLNKWEWFVILIVMGFAIYGSLTYAGCIEKYNQNTTSPTLNSLQYLCSDNPLEGLIKWRLFGMANVITLIIFIITIVYLKCKKCKTCKK